MNNYKDTLKKILNAINYTKDTDTFIKEFIKILKVKAMIALIKRLNPDKQKELENLLKENENSTENTDVILKRYFSKKEIEDSFSKASSELTLEYIDSIKHTLSDSQKKKLEKVFKDLKDSKA